MSRLKTLEDEWVYVDSPAPESAVDINNPAAPPPPHMHTPVASSSERENSNDSTSSDAIPTEFGVVERSDQGDTTNVAATNEDPVAAHSDSPVATAEPEETAISTDPKTVAPSPAEAAEEPEDAPPAAPLKPYGLPAIRELLRVLISLLNPHEHKHTDSMRLMALGILNVAFEVGGRSIARFETLRNLVADDFCKYLFQVMTPKSPTKREKKIGAWDD